MLEIVLLISFTRKIGVMAVEKGLKPGAWKAYVVLAWFGAEIVGIILGFILLGRENYGYLLFGYAFAIGSYYLLKYKLKQMPDVNDDWLSKIGQPDTDAR